MSNLLFQVGDRVLITKPDTPAIAWEHYGLMDVYIDTVQTIKEVKKIGATQGFQIVGDKRWWFSFDCAKKVDDNESKDSEDSKDMVTTQDGQLIPREDAVLTDLDGWVLQDDVLVAHDGTTMRQGNEDDHDYRYTHDGELHSNDVLYYVDDVDEYYHEDDMGHRFFWHESDETYRTYEPENDDVCHGYHNGPRNYYQGDAKFRFGVEVEKEDSSPIEDYELSDVDDTGWSRERDGSLDSEIGYELVSPVYNLFSDRFDNDISKSILKDHINADYSSSCGGHMGFSIANKSGAQVFDLYSGFFPLLFSMYRKRLRGSWSAVRNNKTLKRGSHRYSAVNVQREYVEFRIFSAVKNVTNLLWRRDLLRIMAKNPKKGVMWWISQAMNPNSALHNHLLKVYDADKIRLVCAYAAAIAERMNGRDYGKYIHFADEDVKQQAKHFVNNL